MIKRFYLEPTPETVLSLPETSLEPEVHDKYKHFVIIARIDEKIVGVIDGIIQHGLCHIKTLTVLQQVKKQGIGACLLKSTFKMARLDECVATCLETLDFQGPNYYPKFDFVKLATVAWGDTLDHYMYRALSDADLVYENDTLQLEYAQGSDEADEFSSNVFAQHTTEQIGVVDQYFRLGFKHQSDLLDSKDEYLEASCYLGGMRINLVAESLEVASSLISSASRFVQTLPLNHPIKTVGIDAWQSNKHPSLDYTQIGFTLACTRQAKDGYTLHRYHAKINLFQ
jgi:hypothetical protein